jgi:hypothetical protein
MAQLGFSRVTGREIGLTSKPILEPVAPELEQPVTHLCWIKRGRDVDFVCKRSCLCLCWDCSKGRDRMKALKGSDRTAYSLSWHTFKTFQRIVFQRILQCSSNKFHINRLSGPL